MSRRELEFCFFRMGVMEASFMPSGTNQVVRELLIIGRSVTAIGPVTCFRIVMGRGSVGEQVRVDFRMELI